MIPLTLADDTQEAGEHGALAGITIPAGGSSATGTIATTDDTDDETMSLDGNRPSSMTAGTPTSVTLTRSPTTTARS